MTIRIDAFIWLRSIVEKLLDKHGVSPEEVEQVFFNRPRYRLHEKGRVQNEDLYTALGQTDAGRYLIVFFIFKPHHRALVISAREMDKREKRQYGRK
jgi:uncharacterized protein